MSVCVCGCVCGCACSHTRVSLNFWPRYACVRAGPAGADLSCRPQDIGWADLGMCLPSKRTSTTGALAHMHARSFAAVMRCQLRGFGCRLGGFSVGSAKGLYVRVFGCVCSFLDDEHEVREKKKHVDSD